MSNTKPTYEELEKRVLELEAKPTKMQLSDDQKQALKEGEASFKNIFESHNAPMLLIEPETGDIIDANDAAARFYGYTKPTLCSLKIDDINTLSSKEISIERNKAVIEKRNYFVFTHKLANGEICTVEVNSSPIVFQDKRVLFSIINDITDRKKNEQALKESEKRFKAFMNYFPGATFIKNKENQLLYCNEKFAQMLQTKPDEIIGKHIDENISSELEKVYEQENKEVIEDSKLLKTESIFPYNGKDFHWLTYKFPIEVETGNLLGAISIDITDRKKNEQVLKESENKNRELIEAIQEGLWQLDKNNNTTYVNRSMAEMLGYSIKEMMGRHLFSFMDDQGVAKATKLLEQRKKGIKEQHDFEFISKNGDRVFLLLESVPLKDENGNYSGALATAMDITDRKKAEQALKESEEKFRTIIETAISGFWITNIKGEFLEVNDSYCKMSGYTRDELLTMKMSDVEVIESSEEIKNRINYILKKGYNLFERKHRRKDGSVFDVSIKIQHQQFDEDKFIVFIDDITDRKKAEHELKRSEYVLNEVQNISKIGGWEYDVESGETYFSDEVFNIYRLPKNKMFEAEEGASFYHPDDRGLVLDSFAKAVSDGIAYDLEVRFINANGENMWVKTAGKPITENGKIIKILGVLQDITDRKKAEEELKKNQIELNAIIQNSPICIKKVDLDFNLQFMSMAGIKELKVGDVNKFYNAPYPFYFFPEPMKELMSKKLKEVKETEKIEQIDGVLADMEGNRMWYTHILVPVKNHKGQLNHILVLSMDITSRKQAEQALKESEELLNETGNIAKIGGWYYDVLENKHLWTDQLYRLHELPIDHVLTVEEGLAFYDKKSRIIIKQALDEAITNAKSYDVEVKINTAKNNIKDVRVIGIPVKDNSGKVIALRGSMQDITEKKQIEQELLRSKERAESYLNVAAEIILMLDENGTITLLNESGHKLFGYKNGELIGKNWFTNCFPQENIEEIKNVFKQTISGRLENVNYYESNIKTKSGEIRTILWHNTLYHDENGKIIGTLSSGEDITERKETEKALIEKERLGAIGQTASAVAHDFNNSLQAIYGNLELCQLNENLPEPVRKKIDTILGITSDAAARVQILQKYGGKSNLEIQFKNIDLNKLLKEAIIQSRVLWKDEAQKSGVDIQIETSFVKIPNIMGNNSELRNVFYNIIKNSVEAMPKGGTISFRTNFKEDNVIVEIEDTGIGMDDETKSRVFQPFYTTKGYEAGRGIGMSGVFSIIKGHKGEIKIVRSKPNEGTAIEVRFPVTKSEENQKTEERQEIVDKKVSRILWVDDDKLIRNIASEMIEAIGQEGDVAESGEKALELFKSNNYDILVTDIGMPVMNGWQLTDEIRKLNKEVKIAVLSGWGSQIDEAKLKNHKVNSILAKPFQIKQLKNLIAELSL